MLVALELLPPPTGVELYAHVGGSGGGDGGAEGGAQVPAHATMYSTYRKLPSWANVSTAGVAVVSNV